MRIYAQQATHIREERPLGAYLTVGGPLLTISASADYFINPVLEVEAGANLLGYFGGN
jgi:hypothetical protein